MLIVEYHTLLGVVTMLDVLETLSFWLATFVAVAVVVGLVFPDSE
jgi:hypothetical protein